MVSSFGELQAHGDSPSFLMRGQMKAWGNGVMCPWTLLWLMEGNVYMKRPMALPFLNMHMSAGYTLLGNFINSHYVSSLDKKTDGCVFKTCM